MKHFSLIAIVFILLAICKPVHAKKERDRAFKALLCKEWKLDFYIKSGKKIPCPPGERDDRAFFYWNYSVKSMTGKGVEYGIWKYYKKMKILLVSNPYTPDKFIMKIVSLTKEKCVVQIEDTDGSVWGMQMSAVRALGPPAD